MINENTNIRAAVTHTLHLINYTFSIKLPLQVNIHTQTNKPSFREKKKLQKLEDTEPWIYLQISHYQHLSVDWERVLHGNFKINLQIHAGRINIFSIGNSVKKGKWIERLRGQKAYLNRLIYI